MGSHVRFAYAKRSILKKLLLRAHAAEIFYKSSELIRRDSSSFGAFASSFGNHSASFELIRQGFEPIQQEFERIRRNGASAFGKYTFFSKHECQTLSKHCFYWCFANAAFLALYLPTANVDYSCHAGQDAQKSERKKPTRVFQKFKTKRNRTSAVNSHAKFENVKNGDMGSAARHKTNRPSEQASKRASKQPTNEPTNQQTDPIFLPVQAPRHSSRP